MDVDGVLTDGTFFGFQWRGVKRFCFADVTGIGRALRAGVKIALISGESSPAGMTLVQRFADKLKIESVSRVVTIRPRQFLILPRRMAFSWRRSASSATTLSTFPPWRSSGFLRLQQMPSRKSNPRCIG